MTEGEAGGGPTARVQLQQLHEELPQPRRRLPPARRRRRRRRCAAKLRERREGGDGGRVRAEREAGGRGRGGGGGLAGAGAGGGHDGAGAGEEGGGHGAAGELAHEGQVHVLVAQREEVATQEHLRRRGAARGRAEYAWNRTGRYGAGRRGAARSTGCGTSARMQPMLQTSVG